MTEPLSGAAQQSTGSARGAPPATAAADAAEAADLAALAAAAAARIPLLVAAASEGDLEDVRQLIAGGADLEARDLFDSTALFGAAIEGHTPSSESCWRRGQQ
jgi:hypothetical protein